MTTTSPGDPAPAGGDPGRAVEVPPEARRLAQELAPQVRAVAASLPFGAEPVDFLAAQERLAGDEDGEPAEALPV